MEETKKTIEEYLNEGRADVAKRPAFYRALWAAELWVVGVIEGPTAVNEQGEDVALEGAEVKVSFFEVEGRQVLPCFSSQGLFEQVIPEHQPSVVLTGEDVFKLVPEGVEVMLNPFTETGKSFPAHEIRALRAGVLFRERPTADGEEIALGQPKEYPEELVATIKTYLADQPAVKRAYLAYAYVKSTGEAPHPLIGLELSASNTQPFADLMLELHQLTYEQFGQAGWIDVFELKAGATDAVSKYLLEETTPFFEV